MGKTVNGIYHNIKESDYSFSTENFTFFFSSQFYKRKFIEKYLEHREDINYFLKARFGVEVDLPDYADFILYQKIEKRGYRVQDNKRGVEIWENQAKLSGEMRTKRNYNG